MKGIIGFCIGFHCLLLLPSVQETVLEAITAFLEGKDFEDVIRTAVSLGGDCDTLTCIAGSMAEAFYGVPQDLIEECRSRLPEDILEVLDRFDGMRKDRVSNHCERPDTVQCSMEKLGELLGQEVVVSGFTRLYFWFEDIEVPDESDIGKRIEDPDYFVKKSIDWGHWDASGPGEKQTKIHNMIMSTINSYEPIIYEIPFQNWEKYLNEEDDFVSPLFFLRLQGEKEHWYIFFAESIYD